MKIEEIDPVEFCFWCPDCLEDGEICRCGEDPDEYDAENDRDDWGCVLGAQCLMPSYDHRASECYNVEMAEAWADEAAQNS